MVIKIPVRLGQYELLTEVKRTPRWKDPLFYLWLYIAIACIVGVLGLLATLTIALYDSTILIPDSSSTVIQYRDAKVTPWLRRARMYAESTKENQNADRNTTIAKSEQSGDGANSQIVVCYYTIPGDLNSSRELRPSHIDPRICTHIIVGFASVVNSTISLGKASYIYEDVAELKKRDPKLKVMISAGGMDELRDGFAPMVKTHANRKRFIQSVLNVTEELNLDGLDLDWEFPAWLGSNERQKIYFVQLVEELRKEFDRSGRKLLLSIAVAAPVAIVDQSYNVPQLAEHVDFVNLMSYDYHLYVWYFPITGMNSPLYPRSSESGYVRTLNVNYSAMYWIAKGMPRRKLVIGIPTYGHSYQLDNPLNHDILAPARGFGKLGFGGFVPYTEICTFLENGATSRRDEDSKVPYAYKNTEWISYDDEVSVEQKAEWIKTNGFGGAMLFSLNVDDWSGGCRSSKNETFTLTRTIGRVLLAPRSAGTI